MKGYTTVSMMALAICVAACGGGDNSAASTTTESTTAVTPSATTTTTEVTSAPAALPEGVTAEMVASGETAFKGGPCIACHGADAKGTAMAPDLTDNTWLNIDGSYKAIEGIIKTGVPKPKDPAHAAAMPPMGGAQLSDQQIDDIAAYVYSLSHKG